MDSYKTIVVLAPHTDDGEVGAGGLINKLIDFGAIVHYVAFSICEESVPKPFPKDILAEEVILATAELGILPENVMINRFKVRKFNEVRQQILEIMIELNKGLSPDLVLLPSRYDIHQDHNTIYNEGIRAFKDITVLGYEMPWNNIDFTPGLFVKLNEENICAKKRAFLKYKSQQGRVYDADYLVSLARVRGGQIKKEYAEAFDVIRWVWGK